SGCRFHRQGDPVAPGVVHGEGPAVVGGGQAPLAKARGDGVELGPVRDGDPDLAQTERGGTGAGAPTVPDVDGEVVVVPARADEQGTGGLERDGEAQGGRVELAGER